MLCWRVDVLCWRVGVVCWRVGVRRVLRVEPELRVLRAVSAAGFVLPAVGFGAGGAGLGGAAGRACCTGMPVAGSATLA